MTDLRRNQRDTCCRPFADTASNKSHIAGFMSTFPEPGSIPGRCTRGFAVKKERMRMARSQIGADAASNIANRKESKYDEAHAKK